MTGDPWDPPLTPSEEREFREVESYIRENHCVNRYGAAALALAVLSTEFIGAPRSVDGQVEAARAWLRAPLRRGLRIRDRTPASVQALVQEVSHGQA